jgi:hypothetical protein
VEKKGEGEGVRLALPRGGREEGGGSDRRPRSKSDGHGRHGDDPETVGAAARVGAGEYIERGY